MKIVFVFVITICLIWPLASRAAEPVEVYYFSDPQCQSCSDMESALALMKQSYPEMRIVTLNVASGNDTALILQDLFSLYQAPEKELPAVFVGTRVFTGFDASVVEGIAQTVDSCRRAECLSPSAALRAYYDQIAQKQASQARFPVMLFWAIFIVLWPILGGVAIVIVLKKYHKNIKTLPPTILPQ